MDHDGGARYLPLVGVFTDLHIGAVVLWLEIPGKHRHSTISKSKKRMAVTKIDTGGNGLLPIAFDGTWNNKSNKENTEAENDGTTNHYILHRGLYFAPNVLAGPS